MSTIRKLLAKPASWMLYGIARVAFKIADRIYLPETENPPWWFYPAYHIYNWCSCASADLDEWGDGPISA